MLLTLPLRLWGIMYPRKVCGVSEMKQVRISWRTTAQRKKELNRTKMVCEESSSTDLSRVGRVVHERECDLTYGLGRRL